MSLTDLSKARTNHKWTYDWLEGRAIKLLGDDYKGKAWMITKNPLLGDVAPVTMIANGRAHRLEKFIKEAEDSTRENIDAKVS